MSFIPKQFYLHNFSHSLDSDLKIELISTSFSLVRLCPNYPQFPFRIFQFGQYFFVLQPIHAVSGSEKYFEKQKKGSMMVFVFIVHFFFCSPFFQSIINITCHIVKFFYRTTQKKGWQQIERTKKWIAGQSEMLCVLIFLLWYTEDMRILYLWIVEVCVGKWWANKNDQVSTKNNRILWNLYGKTRNYIKKISSLTSIKTISIKTRLSRKKTSNCILKSTSMYTQEYTLTCILEYTLTRILE